MTPFTATFYSFKGGVGRTVLAANIAALLARSGKTLLWDLDVEAPGLHRIGDLASAKVNEKGFFEWLLRWQTEREFDAPSKRDLQALAKCLLPVDRQRNLYILPAHGEEADFTSLYQQINWDQFLREEPERGLGMFRALIDYFGSQDFRYIVLDSRTGITDIGGVLAALLPHVTVMVGNYGVQNTAGLRAIWNALQRQVQGKDADRELPPLRLEMVASPVPVNQPEKIAEMRRVWLDYFGESARNLLEIPESPQLRLSEHILATHGQDSDIVAQYTKLAERLQAIDAERHAEESATAQALAARPDLFDPRDPRASRAAQGKRFEERVAGLLRLLGYRVEPEQTLDGNRVDLIATLKQGLDELVYLVECKDHAKPKGKDVVEKLKAWLDTQKARTLNARGMVVAKGFSPQAIEFAKSVHIRLFTPEDLERGLLDFGPYLNRLLSEFAASPLAANYIAQKVELEKAPGTAIDLLPHADAWAEGQGNRLWVLLGDYGTSFSLDATQFNDNLELKTFAPFAGGGGKGRQRLCLEDGAEKPQPYPWIPRRWPIADFPELLLD